MLLDKNAQYQVKTTHSYLPVEQMRRQNGINTKEKVYFLKN